MDVMTRVGLASDREVEMALNVMLKGLTISRPELAQLFADSDNGREALAREIPDIANAELLTRDNAVKAQRAILVQLAQSSDFAPGVASALEARKKLLEPVTTALVLAGIVMLLSTEIKVEYKEVDGKRSTSVSLNKAPTSEGILKKFFGLFHS